MAHSSSNPPPPTDGDLDARLDAMLRTMDEAQKRVQDRLEPPPENEAREVDTQVKAALDHAAMVRQSAPPPHSPPADVKPVQKAADVPTGLAAAVPSSRMSPPATIKELDEKLAQTVVTVGEDDFADGLGLVGTDSLDVPLPPSAPAASMPEPTVIAAAAVTPVEAPAPVAHVAAPAPAPVAAVAPPPPAPAPVKAPTPPPAPVARPAPVAPKPIPAPKPAGPTWKDAFWKVATPIIEPFAMRLGKLPATTQHTAAWIGACTIFMAVMVWGYVAFFQETRPPSAVEEEAARAREAKASSAAPESHADAHEEPKHGH